VTPNSQLTRPGGPLRNPESPNASILLACSHWLVTSDYATMSTAYCFINFPSLDLASAKKLRMKPQLTIRVVTMCWLVRFAALPYGWWKIIMASQWYMHQYGIMYTSATMTKKSPRGTFPGWKPNFNLQRCGTTSTDVEFHDLQLYHCVQDATVNLFWMTATLFRPS
jgi:hypothetical protein